jgi:hypothetical protein
MVSGFGHGGFDSQNGAGFRVRRGGHSPAVKCFRYALDPLCLVACGLYVLSRLAPMPGWSAGWFRDVLFLPVAVPVFLWIERRLGLRTDDAPPSWGELMWLFLVWSVAAEGVAPLLFEQCTADALDILAYAAGGIIAGSWWTRRP